MYKNILLAIDLNDETSCRKPLLSAVGLGESIGTVGLQACGGFLLGKASNIRGAAVHAHSRATRTEQRAWRTTRAALVPRR